MKNNLEKYVCVYIHTYIYESLCCTPETNTLVSKSTIFQWKVVWKKKIIIRFPDLRGKDIDSLDVKSVNKFIAIFQKSSHTFCSVGVSGAGVTEEKSRKSSVLGIRGLSALFFQ